MVLTRFVHMNVIAILGAVLGLVAFLLPAVSIHLSHVDPRAIVAIPHEPSLSDFVQGDEDFVLVAASSIYLVGLILSFLCPLGGLPMLVGISLVFNEMRESVGTVVTDYYWRTTEVGEAIGLGLCASLLVIAAFLLPISLGLSKGSVCLFLQKAFTWRGLATIRINKTDEGSPPRCYLEVSLGRKD